MKIIDISWPLFPGTTEYKDRQSIQCTKTKIFERDKVRESAICMNLHTGTHVDAPAHFLPIGKTIELVDPGSLWGMCRVLDLANVSEKITADDLRAHELQAGEIILLKTKNSVREITQKFDPRFVYLDASGAAYLADQKIKTVGIDYLSIERAQPEHSTHVTLFQAGITVIEGLRLAHVQPGSYFLICLPLPIVGLDAAPARAVLIVQ